MLTTKVKRSTTKKTTMPQSDQSAIFTETARALGADEDEATFKAKLAAIARQKPRAEDEKNTPSAEPRPEQPSRPTPKLPDLSDEEWKRYERNLPNRKDRD